MTEVNKTKKEEFNALFKEMKNLIDLSKKEAVNQINSIIIMSYWEVGNLISKKVLNAQNIENNPEVIRKLSSLLTFQYGAGFNKMNLKRIIKFYTYFKDKKAIEAIANQFSWSHFIEFIKIEDDLKRNFYIAMCRDENWSVKSLRKRVNSMLFERAAISKKPEEIVINEVNSLSDKDKMSTSMFFRDPYLLDFLELKHDFSEKKLKPAILKEIEYSIIDFGCDFSFITRRKKIQVNKKDYKIDLLFFHRKLQRLIVFKLKLKEYEKEDKEEIRLYLKWLSKYEKHIHEKEPIAIVLYSSEESESIKIVDLDVNKNTSEYWNILPPESILMDKLHKSIQYAKSNLVSKDKTTEKQEE